MAGLVHYVASTRHWFTRRSAERHLCVSLLLHVAHPSRPWCPAVVGRRIQAGDKVTEGKGAREGGGERGRETEKDRQTDRRRQTEIAIAIETERGRQRQRRNLRLTGPRMTERIWSTLSGNTSGDGGEKRRRGKEGGDRGFVVSLWCVLDTVVPPEMATSRGVR